MRTESMRSFNTWTAVLLAARDDVPMWYLAPLDRHPVRVYVLRVYKNGKLRLRGGDTTFTADHKHLDRFRY